MESSKVRFGIVAVRPPNKEVLHFCGYKKKPEEETFAELWRELLTDPEFGLVGKMEDVKLIPATPEQVEFFKKQIRSL